MPAKIRNLKKNCGVKEFEINLDQFLAPIPDQPVIGTLLTTTKKNQSPSLFPVWLWRW